MLRKRGQRTEAPHHGRALTIANDLDEVGRVRDFVKHSLEGLHVSERDFFKIELSLVEVCVNIILYAYPKERHRGDLHFRSWREGRRIYFEVRDDGVPFDPRSMKRPDLKEIMRTARKGGFGIFLSRSLMDGFNYRREDGQNILTLYKKVRPGRPARA